MLLSTPSPDEPASRPPTIGIAIAAGVETASHLLHYRGAEGRYRRRSLAYVGAAGFLLGLPIARLSMNDLWGAFASFVVRSAIITAQIFTVRSCDSDGDPPLCPHVLIPLSTALAWSAIDVALLSDMDVGTARTPAPSKRFAARSPGFEVGFGREGVALRFYF